MIIPSIDLMGGQAVQLVQGRVRVLEAGDPRPIAERFALAGEIAVVDLDAALGRGSNAGVIRELLRLAPCRVGGGIRDVDTALEWLDLGATRVVLGTAAEPSVLRALPPERVIAALDAWEGEVVVEGWRTRTGRSVLERVEELREYVGGFLVTFVEVEGKMEGTPLDRVPAIVDAAGDIRVTVAGGVTTAGEVATLDRLGVDAQIGMALYTDRLDLGDAIAAPLRSDRPDNLWPTVVVDESGTALGLAYSNAQSLRTAVRDQSGVYWSRRRGLWRKGETSGATQRLLRVDPDCDRDALRFTVRQRGAGFCHLERWSCFGEEQGLGALERRIGDRLEHPAPGSLTGRLAADPSFLRAKIIEEAGELVDALEELDAVGSDAVVHEAADLLYFTLVGLASRGVRLSEVESELDRRARRIRRREPRRAPPRPPAALGARGLLRRVAPADVTRHRTPVASPAVLVEAGRIVEDVRTRGEAAVREHAERFGDLEPGAPLVRTQTELQAALTRLPADQQALLRRVAERIRRFARAQLESTVPCEVAVPGGIAGDRLVPVRHAGCYAPGGRFPLPSSVLMTAVTARVAGVRGVWIASPCPAPITLAAAAVAGADGLLSAGGAHGVAALTYGIDEVPSADVVVGPGNRWVTAAKQLLTGKVGIDLLAGPSELLVLATDDCSPALVAADLLAQAEHAPDALPILIALSEGCISAVERELDRQLLDLPTAGIARQALAGGFATVASSIDEAVAISDAIAPEHLQLHGALSETASPRVRRFGSLFVGARSPEVYGDYGAGPNHTLPTGGTARFSSGLSVFSFLTRPTWLDIRGEGSEELSHDSAALARLEGLEAHARAAEARGTMNV